MPITLLDQVEFSKIPSLNFVLPVVTSNPSPVAADEGRVIYNTTNDSLYYCVANPSLSWVQIAKGGDLSAYLPLTGGTLSGNLSFSTPTSSINSPTNGDLYVQNTGSGAVKIGTGLTGFVETAFLRMPVGATEIKINAATPINTQGSRIYGVPTPSGSSDVVPKGYVDAAIQGLDAKASCKFATTTNIANLSTGAPNTVDGGALTRFDRILVKDQTTPAQNGIYYCDVVGTGANGTWLRALDMDAAPDWNSEIPAAYTWVEGGATNQDTGWVCTSDQGGTLGTTAITWIKFNSVTGGIEEVTIQNAQPATNVDIWIDLDEPDPPVGEGGGGPTGPASGDLTGFYPSPTINNNAVTNTKLADMATLTIKGNATGATADPTDMTVATVKGFLTYSKSDVGLGNVDNTADTAKPVSTAQQTALNLKQDTSGKGAVNGYASLDASTKVPIAQVPTGTTASTVSLGNHNHDAAYAPIAGAAKRYSADLPAITGGTGLVVNHTGINTRDATVAVYRTTTPWDVVSCGVEMTSTTSVTLRFAASYAANTFRVVIVA